ncbi:hypothetical protein EW145_g6825 [Phellinidium pouzarii]|uniref:Sorbose reductase sou1 n=1 Tax=Phellinidium pouzarii TaxID=167371 RepID=A0A4S4KXZ6_9AGAM|nr:hypothetical protein EW145_g6825 [Phellinidium pouzarii]
MNSLLRSALISRSLRGTHNSYISPSCVHPSRYITTSPARKNNDTLVGVQAALRARSDPTFTPRPTLLQKEFDLTGRVAVVSGGNRGLGLEISEALCEAGAIVHCLDLPETPGDTWHATQKYVKRLNLPSARLEYANVDVTNQGLVWDTIEKIAENEGGRLDVCIAAAGIITGSACLDCPAEEFSKVMNVNTNGVFYLAQAAGRQMVKYGRPGSIILIASASGTVANIGEQVVAYNASKSAVLQIARSMACELGQKGIRVNTISPGYIRTDMTSVFLDARAQLQDTWASQNPLGRLGRPDELRGVVTWLASDASTFCTGSEFVAARGDLLGITRANDPNSKHISQDEFDHFFFVTASARIR